MLTKLVQGAQVTLAYYCRDFGVVTQLLSSLKKVSCPKRFESVGRTKLICLKSRFACLLTCMCILPVAYDLDDQCRMLAGQAVEYIV